VGASFEHSAEENLQGASSSVERCSAADVEELLRFRSAVHGPGTIFSDPDYFRWMYQNGPSGAGDGMSCWVYRRNGRISGQIGGTKVALKVGNRVVDALWALDGVLDASCRGQGILSALVAPVSEERDVVMATELHPAGKQAVLRAGWMELGTLEVFVRPIDVAAILRARGLRLAATTLGGAISSALRALESIWSSVFSLRETPHFDGRVDRVWAEASASYPVICRRDRAFLDWRFGRYPAPRYRFYYLERGAETAGYAVIRFGTRGGLPAAYLVDFFCAPLSLPDLLALFVDLGRREGMVTACCLHRNPISTCAFAALGFIQRDTGWPLMAKVAKLSPSAESLVRTPRNWFVTAADSDLDRPRPGEEGRA
jgi:hypothetical protein